MKIRKSFISNSSSSSFIIGLKKLPESEAELKEMMFPNEKDDDIIADDYFGCLAVSDVVRHVFLDINDVLQEEKNNVNMKYAKRRSLKNDVDIVEEISAGFFEGFPETDYNKMTWHRAIENEFFQKYNKPLYKAETKDELSLKEKWLKALDEDSKQENKNINEAAEDLWKSKKSSFRDLKIFVLSYADEDGFPHNLLEHGNIFRNIPHIRISHH